MIVISLLNVLNIFMKDRIAQFLISENISSAEFADRIGVQRSSVSHILNERNSPSTSFVQKMLSNYKNVNPRWLLLGEGSMYTSPEIVNQEPSLFSYPKGENLTSDLDVGFKDKAVDDQNVPNDNLLQNKQSESVQIKSKEQGKEKQESGKIIYKTTDIKDIERIILFYKDKTFSEYKPSQ